MRSSILRTRIHELPKSGFLTSHFVHDLPGTRAKGPVDVIYFPPRSGELPRRVIVFFPGNPGLIGYYPPFLHKLQSLIHPSHALIGLSHLGHCPSLPHPSRALTLSEQIEAKCEFVRSLWSDLEELQQEENGGGTPRKDEECEEEKISISLMGHSVGAEMCIQVTQRLEESNRWILPPQSSSSPDHKHQSRKIKITALFLLFPTLANIAKSPNGISLRPIFHFPLIQLLPLFSYLLQPILFLLSTFSPTTSSSTSSSSSVYAPNPTTISFLRSPTTISHILHLARSEMTSIMDPDLEYYGRREVRERIWAYFGYEDGWVGDGSDELKSVLRGDKRRVGGDESKAGAGMDQIEQETEAESVDVERDVRAGEGDLGRLMDCVEGVPHAFCLATKHTDIVARHTAKFVREAFSDDDHET